MEKASKEMKFIPNCDIFSEKQIKIIEEQYNAKFVFDSCIKNKESKNWVNHPYAIFYIAKRPEEDIKKYPEGSNYIALTKHTNYETDTTKILIANGITATEPFQALFLSDGRVVYSTYRHDFRKIPNSNVFVDGGRDYLRYGGNGIENIKTVICQLINGKVNCVI